MNRRGFLKNSIAFMGAALLLPKTLLPSNAIKSPSAITDGHYFDITGTTTITSIDPRLQAGDIVTFGDNPHKHRIQQAMKALTDEVEKDILKIYLKGNI